MQCSLGVSGACTPQCGVVVLGSFGCVGLSKVTDISGYRANMLLLEMCSYKKKILLLCRGPFFTEGQLLVANQQKSMLKGGC